MSGLFFTQARALLVAAGSVLLGYNLLSRSVAHAFLAVGAVVAVVGIGWLLNQGGRRLLAAPKAQTVPGVTLMESWLLVPLALASAASGVAIVVTVWLAAPESASVGTEKLLGALSAGITAFLTAMWVEPSKEVEATIGKRIQTACMQSFKGRLASGETDSRLARVLNDAPFNDPLPRNDPRRIAEGIDDWASHGTRMARARVIREELRSVGRASTTGA